MATRFFICNETAKRYTNEYYDMIVKNIIKRTNII